MKLSLKGKIKIKKAVTSLLLALMLLVQNPYTIALAQEVPTAPVAPTVPVAPEVTSTPPVAPTAPPPPTLEELLTATPTPTSVPETPTPTSAPEAENTGSNVNNENDSSDSDNEGVSSNTGTASTSEDQLEGTGAIVSDGGNGSVSVVTGDANNNGNIGILGNTNASIAAPSDSGGNESAIVNNSNGDGSTNSASTTSNNTTNSTQNNSATVTNNLTQQTVSGDNSASKNTGGDVNIETGDANTSGTIINTINTNVNGVAVYEFNVTDDHMGDFVLNYTDANCLSGCSTLPSSSNAGNGADTENTTTVDSNSTTNTFQNNDATLTNNMLLSSNSGDNTASKNTGGDVNIETGDANVQGSVLNFVNNNIDGKVIYSIVNVYGDLIGDIVMPDGTVVSCCFGSGSALNSGNGDGSTNTAAVNQNTTENVTQFNNADIVNTLILDGNTGDNSTDRNTGGAVSVETGDTNIVAQVLNVANTNILGGDLWLVIVNEAGKWIGRIIGAPNGQNFAGSTDFEFAVADDGTVTANSGNGDGSTNTAAVNQNTETNTTQTNNATIVNNVNLSANTGGNTADRNTGGNTSIKTGDSNIVANIVNFVNTNVVGTGRLFVTVVNVFGSWLGDFVGPGQHKDEVQVPVADNSNNGVGGAANSGSSGGTSNSGTSSSNSQANQGGENVLGTKTQLKKKVLAMSTVGGDNLGNEIAISEEVGNPTEQDTPVAGKKVIKINLAFFTPVIPLLIWFILKKRKASVNEKALPVYTSVE